MLPVFRTAAVLARSPSFLKQNASVIAAVYKVNTPQVQQIAPHSALAPQQTQQQSQVQLLQQQVRSMSAANHGKIWFVERVVTVGLMGLIPTALFVYHPSLDYLLATALCLHSHWGLHGICCDYIRPKLFGAMLAKMAELVVYAFSIAAFGCVMYLNYNDVGLIHAFQMLWKL